MTRFVKIGAAAVVIGGIAFFAGRGIFGDRVEQEAHEKKQRPAASGHMEKEEDEKDEAKGAKHEKGASEEEEKKEKAHGEKDEKGEKGEKSDEDEEEEAVRVIHNSAGETIIALDKETQERAGLATIALTAGSLRPERIAYGRLEEDPLKSFTLRAPLAGVLRPQGSAWPQLGQILQDGTVIGQIEPRLGPVERSDLATRLLTAKGEVDEIAADLSAAQASFESKKKLSTNEKIVSERAVEEAEAKVKGLTARLKSAQETVKLIESTLSATTGPTGPSSLVVAAGGEVVELAARPDEAVEAGQIILRVARYERLLARVELPGGERLDKPPASARLIVLGQEAHPLEGRPMGTATSINPLTTGQVFLFGIETSGMMLRPSMPITAYLATAEETRAGVLVPAEAVLRFAGRTWVWVQTDTEQFTRRAVDDLRPMEGGWFAPGGVKLGDMVVVRGGQMLLSDEFTSHAKAEEEGD